MTGPEAKDIVAVSIPFTVGVVVAALLPLRGESFLWPALAASVGMVAMYAALLKKGKGTVAIMCLYFLLGVICSCNGQICGNMHTDSGTVIANEAALGKLLALIERTWPDSPECSGLVKALLTGKKDALEAGTIEAFRKSGASHILALSGLHLGVIYSFLSKGLAVLGNSRIASAFRSLLIVALSAFYVKMTGASPSLVRAFIFICVNEAAGQSPGRKRSRMSAFSTALTVQLALDPGVVESLSFQLSYLAMLGILCLYPRLEQWYPASSRMDLMRKIWKSMALSISCQIFTAPAVWFRFGTFPKCFLLTNLLSLPLTEVLIMASVTTLTLEAMGICPEMMQGLCEMLARALLNCLRTIASL